MKETTASRQRRPSREGPIASRGALARLDAVFRRLAGLLTPKPSLVWITPSLAQGPAPRDSQIAALARAGVDSVLDLRAEASADAGLLARHGLRYKRVPIADRTAPDPESLNRAVDWVMKELAADRRVLVHCHAGAGRSPFVACAVLLRMGYDLQRAYDAVRRLRPEMVLTEDQVEALRRYSSTPEPQNS